MSLYRIKEIWANIQLSSVEQNKAQEEDLDGEMINENDTSTEELLPLDSMWYAKSALIIDNSTKLSQRHYIWTAF